MPLTFACQGKLCGATLDDGGGTTGLLIVSGGNEIRAGTFNGQARLAAQIASAGFPVFRYDRRGIGDSEGENRGFRRSRKDIAAALAAFRAIAPHVERVVGFGNCDAAAAIMLAGGEGFDGLILSNPWTVDEAEAGDATSPTAIRARYLQKLRNPAELLRLVTGKVDLRKLAGGIAEAGKGKSAPSTLAGEIREGLAQFAGPVEILIAGRDRTGQLFLERWDRDDARIRRCPGADHSYSGEEAQAWLRDRLLAALRS